MDKLGESISDLRHSIEVDGYTEEQKAFLGAMASRLEMIRDGTFKSTEPLPEFQLQALSLYKPPFKFMCGYIFDGGHNMFADGGDFSDQAARIRGWGRLGYMENAEKIQDAAGELFARALTELWERLGKPVGTILLTRPGTDFQIIGFRGDAWYLHDTAGRSYWLGEEDIGQAVATARAEFFIAGLSHPEGQTGDV